MLIEGTREIGDSGPQKYRWTITHNPTTDLFEAVQVNPEDQQNAIRFEGNLTGEPPHLELKGQFGNGGGSEGAGAASAPLSAAASGGASSLCAPSLATGAAGSGGTAASSG